MDAKPTQFGNDPSGKPIWALDAEGHPICGAGKDTACQSRIRMENGRCRSHGGASTGRPPTTGKRSKRLQKAIRSREQFLEALAGGKEDRVRPLIDRMYYLAMEGKNPAAAEYIFNQLFGAPKSTIVTEISNRDLFGKVVRITARFLEGDVFESWLQQVTQELELVEGSMSATP